ncbi:MAG: hypothetical protein DWI21_09975 [Planctomycetota bacterium]|nr:MAG: hypothetical protein DWI21_09975 [Planctomycetota bacterium]GDY10211.1 hypothetical protein LBMAG52_36990 [Planctomycetia bacterium]
MSSIKSHSVPTPESVHDVWLSQRAELERDLFDGWAPEVRTAPPITRPQVVADAASIRVSDSALRSPDASGISLEPAAEQIETDKARHQEWLKQSNAAAVQHRVEHQQRVTETLSQHHAAFFHEMARQRAAFEHELSARETAWATQRDQEWAALRSAKEVQVAAQQRLKDEMSTQRVREREELLQWRRQAEAELAEAHRLFEQERLKQQQEGVRQREVEMSQLRCDREELDSRVRQVHSEFAYARQRQEDELRQARDMQSAQLRGERAELDKLRDVLLEKVRREQVVLENGFQFFGQQLSRVSEELCVAQRGLQTVSVSASKAHPSELLVEPGLTSINSQPMGPTIFSLDESRERLKEFNKPPRAVA